MAIASNMDCGDFLEFQVNYELKILTNAKYNNKKNNKNPIFYEKFFPSYRISINFDSLMPVKRLNAFEVISLN